MAKQKDMSAMIGQRSTSSSNSISKEIEDNYKKVWGNVSKNVIEVPMSNLVPYEQPFTIHRSKLMALEKSIKVTGLIQPIIVRKKDMNTYEILSGHHRYLACQELNYKSIECIVVDVDDQMATQFVIYANIQRDKPTMLELARAINDLRDSNIPYTMEEVADMFDVAKKQAYRIINVSKMHPDLQVLVNDGKISQEFIDGIVRALDMDDQKALADYLNKYLKKLSRTQMRRVIEHAEEGDKITEDLINKVCAVVEKTSYKNKMYVRLSETHDMKDMSEKEINELVYNFLDSYFSKLEKED